MNEEIIGEAFDRLSSAVCVATLLVVTATGKQLKRQTELPALETADELLDAFGLEECESLTNELHALRGKLEACRRTKSA